MSIPHSAAPRAPHSLAAARSTNTVRRLAAPVVLGIILRLVACTLLPQSPDAGAGVEERHLETALSLGSGEGPLMRPPLAVQGGSDEGYVDVVEFLKQAEAAGVRVDAQHPYPPDDRRWQAATLYPHGYSWLELTFYRMGNYSGMLHWLPRFQALVDGLTCLLLFVFARRLFGDRVALAAAWVYALLPAAIVMSVQLVADSLAGFLAAAVLACAIAIRHRLKMAVITGLVIGVACQFRPEFLLWVGIVAVLLLISKKADVVAAPLLALLLTFALTLLPWAFWSHHATRHALWKPSGQPATMYQSLGELPHNPWDIRLGDDSVVHDALQHGFASAWTPDADVHYGKAFLAAIAAHPLAYADIVIVHRLPLALAPPYSARLYNPDRISFTQLRLKEGLSRWGVLRHYPGLVFREMWFEMLMGIVSTILLAAMVICTIRYRSQWRLMAWLVLPWLATVIAVCLVKQVEPRNLAATLPVLAAAFAVFVQELRRAEA